MDWLASNWQLVLITTMGILLLFSVYLALLTKQLRAQVLAAMQNGIDKQQLLQTQELIRNESQKCLLKLAESERSSSHLIEKSFADFRMKTMRQIAEYNSRQEEKLGQLRVDILQSSKEHMVAMSELINHHQQQISQSQLKSVEQLIEMLNATQLQNRQELSKAMQATTDTLTRSVAELTQKTEHKLADISQQVEKRLADGFDKTTQTFADIVKRLALIDDAQKKITELSSNVVSLQEVLADKRSRGAFGEVQLSALLRNVLPDQHLSFQHQLSNGKVADCVLVLPPPTGNVVVDAKFPLESYRNMSDEAADGHQRKQAERQFKIDVKKHIYDIAHKYLIEGETADGAVMFIPAEAIFAEIHAHHADLVQLANEKRVWLTSPTTLMAILTTARSVLKDEATRKQIHIIQDHLVKLSGDFNRFRGRFNNLARHIDQAASDVKQIHTSANKISDQFVQIENVDLLAEEAERVLE